MKFKYVGPHDAVEVPGHGVVDHATVLEVTAAAAQSLLAQKDTWRRVDQPKRRRTGNPKGTRQDSPPATPTTTTTDTVTGEES